MDERDVHIKEINRIQAERDEARADLARIRQERGEYLAMLNDEARKLKTALDALEAIATGHTVSAAGTAQAAIADITGAVLK
jgi:predicted nuclease with TOPRIM domain